MNNSLRTFLHLSQAKACNRICHQIRILCPVSMSHLHRIFQLGRKQVMLHCNLKEVRNSTTPSHRWTPVSKDISNLNSRCSRKVNMDISNLICLRYLKDRFPKLNHNNHMANLCRIRLLITLICKLVNSCNLHNLLTNRSSNKPNSQ